MTKTIHTAIFKNDAGCLARIMTLRPQFTKKEKIVADFVLSRRDDTVYMSITEVADLSKAGYGSVIRFCKRLGYSGFQDFKVHLAENIAVNKTHRKRGAKNSAIDQIAESSINDIRNTLQLLSREDVDYAASLLSNANTVLTIGCAGSFIVAKELEYRLMRFGINAMAISDNHIQSIRSATLGPKDVALLISFTGSTQEILRVGKTAKKSGAKIGCLTNFAQSPVAEISDFRLVTGIHVDPLKAEVVSKVAIDFVIEVLFRRILKIRRKSKYILRKTFDAVSDRQL